MSGILISLTGNQKNICAFFGNVFYLPFHLVLSSTHVTSTTSYMCLFMRKIHLKHVHVICVENILRKKGNHKKHAKKTQKPIFDHSQRYQNSRHIFRNPKVHQSVMASVITHKVLLHLIIWM